MIRNLVEPHHLLVIGVVVFLLFGASKLPALGKNLGRSIREFKGEMRALKSEDPVEPASPTASVDSANGHASRDTAPVVRTSSVTHASESGNLVDASISSRASSGCCISDR